MWNTQRRQRVVITRSTMVVGLVWWCVVTCQTACPGDSDPAVSRVKSGLLVFYDFQGDGPIVADHSGFDEPLDLEIQDIDHVQRRGGSLLIQRPTSVLSRGPANKVLEAVGQTGAVTVEAWILPATLDQEGPARIISLSSNPSQRNLTIGQNINRIDARLRTDRTNANGIPATVSPEGSLRRVGASSEAEQPKPLPTHVVFTRNRSGDARIYIDGRQRHAGRVSGDVGNWDPSFRLALGNEPTGDRPWLGELFMVAIYNRSLSPPEVARNFSAGCDASVGELSVEQTVSGEQIFETRIAPLFARHCLECHDSASKEGGLDLSRKASAFGGGDSGSPIIRGDAKHSLLWKSVADDLMPSDRPPLDELEKQQLSQWIDAGAPWTVDFIDPAIYRSPADSRFGSELWLQRLTLPEYIATVRDSLGVDIAEQATQLIPPDKRADGFRNTAYNLNVDLQHVVAYGQLARMIVDKLDVDAFAKRFSKRRLLTDDHMRVLIADLGKHVLRRPLTADEIVLYRGISTTVASAGGNFQEAVGMILEAMLQSPKFLYRIENQRGDGSAWFVDEYELASRVSYILWGAPPDQELIRAADSGELSDPILLSQQIDRMLLDRRAQERSVQFVVEWLNLDRLVNLRPDPNRFPHWHHEIATDMRQETIRFFEELVWGRGRPLSELMNAQFTYATPRLAEHYGFETRGDGWRRYDLANVPSRGGLLTQGSLLTIGGDDASMVTRGLFVLNDLLFSEVGDPPPGLDTTPVPASPGRSHRMIAAERVESRSCGGCHSRFEPLAYGLEIFDGLGSFHQLDRFGNKLRQDGEILFPGQATSVRYATSSELMDLLAGSDRVAQCITRKLTQFALGRPLFASDAAVIREIHQAAQTDRGTYQAVIKAIVLSDLVQKIHTEPESVQRP